MKIILSVENNLFVITGDVDAFEKNKRVRLLLKTNLSYRREDDKLIVNENNYSINEINEILQIASRFVGAELQYDSGASEQLDLFATGEVLFAEFSQKAKNIRNNNCDVLDFQNFSDILDENMTHRHLYPLQLLSAYHLAFSQNACNFSVPGAGKTSIVYGAYAYLHALSKDNPKYIDKIFIVGPLSSFGPWELEFQECFGRKPNCQRINGSMSVESKKQYFYGGGGELTLLSYQSISSLVDEIKYFLLHNKVMFVLDEAHKIKNTNGGVQASSVMSLANYATSRVVLTGTPAPNGYEDVYNLFHFIWPDHDVINYSKGQLKEMSKRVNDTRVVQLMDNLSPYFIRIKKSDLNLPPAVDNPPIIVPMKDSQRKIYDYIEQRFIDDTINNPVDGILKNSLFRARMIRLQQAATNPALLRAPLSQSLEECDADLKGMDVDDSVIIKEVMKFYKEEIPAKYEVCLNLIQQIISRGEKVIVWAMFIDNIESFHKYLEENNIENRILYGSTPVANEDMNEEEIQATREGIVRQFHQEDCSYKVIIANAFAVAESISLHKACHNAIYMERSFNCAHFLQSKDRIHRYGLSSDTQTNYYYLISQDSVDETISDRLRVKETRMLEIIESMPIPLFDNITNEGDEDIKAIIADYVKRKARKGN